MSIGPREISVPFRPIPLDVPEGMKPNEFFNSPENLGNICIKCHLLIYGYIKVGPVKKSMGPNIEYHMLYGAVKAE
jgi:hypothetical protein